jgi:hypothetical protein
MNILELKQIVDHYIENLDSYEKPEDITVLITLSESSMGPRASCSVKNCYIGFDWEKNQFRLEPDQPLTRKGNALYDPKPIKKLTFSGVTFNGCPKCRMKVTSDDFYCRYCGQRFK